MSAFWSSYTSKDWFVAVLKVLIGVLFLFSGFVKLVPIEPFELKFIELGVASWETAPIIARLLIAFELVLGFLLILNIKPKATSILVLGLLVFFTFYLGYDIYKNGNSGNCGCFGTMISMTPLESIAKNVLMIPMVIVIIVMNRKVFEPKRVHLIIAFVALLSIVLPFVIYPMDSVEDHVNSNTSKVEYKFPVELLPNFNIKGQKIDLTKGEYILPFMSVHCSHCKAAAYKLHIIHEHKELPQIYMILIGEDELVPGFINDTKANFPYYLFNQNDFFKIAGNTMPRIFYVKDGIVKAKFDVASFTEANLLEAIKKNQ